MPAPPRISNADLLPFSPRTLLICVAAGIFAVGFTIGFVARGSSGSPTYVVPAGQTNAPATNAPTAETPAVTPPAGEAPTETPAATPPAAPAPPPPAAEAPVQEEPVVPPAEEDPVEIGSDGLPAPTPP